MFRTSAEGVPLKGFSWVNVVVVLDVDTVKPSFASFMISVIISQNKSFKVVSISQKPRISSFNTGFKLSLPLYEICQSESPTKITECPITLGILG